MNTTTKSLLRVGNSKFSLSPEFPSWGRVSEKMCRDAMDAAKKICSVGKVVGIFVMYNKTIYVTHTKYYIIV